MLSKYKYNALMLNKVSNMTSGGVILLSDKYTSAGYDLSSFLLGCKAEASVDYFFLGEEKVNVSLMGEFLKNLSVKANGKVKIALITSVLSEPCQTLLLKAMEDSIDTLFILQMANTVALMDTVKSRCVTLRMEGKYDFSTLPTIRFMDRETFVDAFADKSILGACVENKAYDNALEFAKAYIEHDKKAMLSMVGLLKEKDTTLFEKSVDSIICLVAVLKNVVLGQIVEKRNGIDSYAKRYCMIVDAEWELKRGAMTKASFSKFVFDIL